MGIRHQEFMRLLVLPASPKATLSWLAYHSCNGCGYTFVGVPTLVIETSFAESTVRRDIAYLVKRTLLVVVGQGGGRGKTTEYLTCPEVAKLSTGDCLLCGRDRNHVSQTLQDVEGFAKNPPPRGGYAQLFDDSGAIPSTTWNGNPPPRGPQPEYRTEPPRARAREADPPASPPGAATPPWFDTLLTALGQAGEGAPAGMHDVLDALAARLGENAVAKLAIARRRAIASRKTSKPPQSP